MTVFAFACVCGALPGREHHRDCPALAAGIQLTADEAVQAVLWRRATDPAAPGAPDPAEAPAPRTGAVPGPGGPGGAEDPSGALYGAVPPRDPGGLQPAPGPGTGLEYGPLPRALAALARAERRLALIAQIACCCNETPDFTCTTCEATAERVAIQDLLAEIGP